MLCSNLQCLRLGEEASNPAGEEGGVLGAPPSDPIGERGAATCLRKQSSLAYNTVHHRNLTRLKAVIS